MHFTPDEAIEAMGTQDAIMLNWADIKHICNQQGCSATEFYEDYCSQDVRLDALRIDAGELFAWLGY